MCNRAMAYVLRAIFFLARFLVSCLMCNEVKVGLKYNRGSIGRSCGYLTLKVIYHPLYIMNNFETNESKLPQDGTQVFPHMVDWLSCNPLRESHHQSPITNHPIIWGDWLSCDAL